MIARPVRHVRSKWKTTEEYSTHPALVYCRGMSSISFWQIFGAVLAANLLTVAFVWAGVNISRREEAKEPFGLYLGVACMTLFFCAGSLYIAFGGQ